MSSSKYRKLALEELRGYSEPPVYREMLSIDSLVHHLLQEYGLTDRIGESEIRSAWLELVGPFLSENSEPMQLKSGILYVRVLQPCVHYELTQVVQKKIFAKLQARFSRYNIRNVRYIL